MNNYFDSIMKTLNDSISSLNLNKFDEMKRDLMSVLKNGKKVVVTGLGKNVPICDKFVGTMVSLGMSAAFMHTNTAIHGDLGMIKNGDMVIMLSKSGETVESIILLNELKKRDITIWSITFNPESSVAKGTSPRNLIVNMDNEGDKWNIVPNNSTTLYLIILQALAITLSEELDISLNDFKVNHPGGYIGKQLNG